MCMRVRSNFNRVTFVSIGSKFDILHLQLFNFKYCDQQTKIKHSETEINAGIPKVFRVPEFQPKRSKFVWHKNIMY